MNSKEIIDAKFQLCTGCVEAATAARDPYVRGYWVGSFGGTLSALQIVGIISKEEMKEAGQRFCVAVNLKAHEEAGLLPGGSIPEDHVRMFKDGTAWCCVRPDFLDLMQSKAGFGKCPDEAFQDLKDNEAKDAQPERLP